MPVILNPDEVQVVAPHSDAPAGKSSPAPQANDWFSQNAPAASASTRPPVPRYSPSGEYISPYYNGLVPNSSVPLQAKGVARPPIPYELKTDAEQLADPNAPTFQNPRTGRITKRQAPGKEGGLANILDSPVTGGESIKQGIEQVAQPTARQKAAGVHKIVSGAFEAATPLMVAGAVGAPVKTAATLLPAIIAQTGAADTLKWLGLPEEYADVASDIMGAVAGIGGHKAEPAAKAKLKAKLEPILEQRAKIKAQDDAIAARPAAQPVSSPSGPVDIFADNEEPATVTGEVLPREAPISHINAPLLKPLHEMSTNELDGVIDSRSKEEDARLVRLFGEEGAKKYKRLDRTANSTYSDKADAAYQELSAMHDSLTPGQQDELFGINQPPEHSLDDAKDMRRAINSVDDTSPEDLGFSIRHSISKFDPANPEANPEAYAQLKRAAEIANEKGWDTSEVMAHAYQYAADRFPDPEDVNFMLDRFRNQQPAAPEAPQAPQATEQPQLESGSPPESTDGHVSWFDSMPEAPTEPGLFANEPASTTEPATTQPEVAADGKKIWKAGDPVPDYDQVVNINPHDLIADPARFQYKQEAIGKGGTTDEFRDVKDWDPGLGGAMAVWQDPDTGLVHPINGHHRTEMAQRTNPPHVNVRFIQAQTPTEARTFGAMLNIGEGKGTALDAAKLFRDGGITPEDLAKYKISPTSKLAVQGMALSKLDPIIYRQVVDGKMTPTRGALIGSLLDDYESQKAAVDFLKGEDRRGKRYRDDEVADIIRSIKNAPTAEEDNSYSLFQDDVIKKNLFPERAEVSASIGRRLAREKSLFKIVGKGDNAERLSNAGNILNSEENQKISQEAAAVQATYDKLKFSAGPVAEALDQAAKEVSEGGTVDGAADRAYAKIKSEFSRIFGGTKSPEELREAPGTNESTEGSEEGSGTGVGDSGVGGAAVQEVPPANTNTPSEGPAVKDKKPRAARTKPPSMGSDETATPTRRTRKSPPKLKP